MECCERSIPLVQSWNHPQYPTKEQIASGYTDVSHFLQHYEDVYPVLVKKSIALLQCLRTWVVDDRQLPPPRGIHRLEGIGLVFESQDGTVRICLTVYENKTYNLQLIACENGQATVRLTKLIEFSFENNQMNTILQWAMHRFLQCPYIDLAIVRNAGVSIDYCL